MPRPAVVREAGAGRRDQLLAAAARLMAERGFHGVGIAELGAATGASGPALYRHFPSKQAVLGAMLVQISERLLEGGRQRAESAAGPVQAIEALVDGHVEFATTESDLIRVQDRDFTSMSAEDQRRVRRLQREYVEVWVTQLRQIAPAVDEERARAAVHAMFGLLNSTPYSGSRLGQHEIAHLLRQLGRVVLLQGVAGLPPTAAG